MNKNLMILSLTALLAACSSSSNTRLIANNGQPQVTRTATATGPISQACLGSSRKARSRPLCGCIQAAADKTLTYADQTVASSFYADPHRAQIIRQSDRPSDEVFWKKYRNYEETAQALCDI